MNLRSLSTLPIAALILSAAVTQTGAAHAATAAHVTPGHLIQPAGLTGYQQVTSGSITDGAGAQTFGSVTCPRGTRVVGGGVAIDDSNLGENLSSSFPNQADKRTWDVFVNNSSTTAGSFRVFADCLKTAPRYAIVVGSDASNPAHTQTAATATCPTGTVPYGGGGLNTSTATTANLNSSYPLSNGWRVYANNSTAHTTTFAAYVICGARPTGYQQVAGPSTAVGPSSQQGSSPECPSGTVVLGGGGLSNARALRANLNTTAPSGSTVWVAYVNNTTPVTNRITGYAVCGAATA